MENLDIKEPIFLASEDDPSLLNRIHLFIETFIFFRLQYFKNFPRGNFLLIKAVGMVTVAFIIIGFIYFVLNVFIKKFFPFYDKLLYFNFGLIHIITVYIAAIYFFYWQISKTLKKNWRYCARLYNEIIKINKKDKAIADKLANALAIDLVLLELWGHCSFKKLFCNELKLALKSRPDKIVKIDKINTKKLTENEALEILQDYQNKLVEQNTTKP